MIEWRKDSILEAREKDRKKTRSRKYSWNVVTAGNASTTRKATVSTTVIWFRISNVRGR